MFEKLLSLFRRKPAPPQAVAVAIEEPAVVPSWSYVSHEWIGVTGGCHRYRVTFLRGSATAELPYKFHAADPDKQKDEAKLVNYFQAEAERLSK